MKWQCPFYALAPCLQIQSCDAVISNSWITGRCSDTIAKQLDARVFIGDEARNSQSTERLFVLTLESYGVGLGFAVGAGGCMIGTTDAAATRH